MSSAGRVVLFGRGTIVARVEVVVILCAGFQPALFSFLLAIRQAEPLAFSLKPPPRWRRYKMAASTRSRGYLPHLEDRQAIYFVTFRLADSLPKDVVIQLRKEREIIKKAALAGIKTPGDNVRLQELCALLRRAERYLDRGLGCCHMCDPRVAKIVADAIRNFRGQRYRLFVWCVMPNHVHVLFSPLQEHKLESIVHSWKSYSAMKANSLLGRTGRLWQREYFDHLVRNEASFRKIADYISDNPKRAGLGDWPWLEIL